MSKKSKQTLAPPYELSEPSYKGAITALLCGSKHPRFALNEDGLCIVEILTPKLSRKELTAAFRAAKRHGTFRHFSELSEYGFTVTFDAEDDPRDCMTELVDALHEIARAINRMNQTANTAYTNAATRDGCTEDDRLVTTWLKTASLR